MNRRQLLLAMPLLALTCAARSQGSRQTLTPLAQRVPAPDFALPDMDGRIHRLSDYRGRVVIVNFWATWCPPCREEMPSLQRAREALRADGVEVLAVDVGEDEDTVFTFTADYPVEFPLLLDGDGAVIGEWPVKGLPTTFVVDANGRIAYRAVGGRAWDDPVLLAMVRGLLE